MASTMTYTVMVDHNFPDVTAAKCGSCEWEGVIATLREVGSCLLTPGDPSPIGRCPECEALAYVEVPVKQDPEELVYACPECKSTDVMEQDWVIVNTGEVVDDTGRYRWCNTCHDENGGGELSNNSGLKHIPRKETKEWKEEHGE